MTLTTPGYLPSEYLDNTAHLLRTRRQNFCLPKKGKIATVPVVPNTCVVYVARSYPPWQVLSGVVMF